MGLREKLIRAALVLVSSACFAACGPEDAMCDRVEGTYTPAYVMRTGTCGPVAPTMLPLDGGESGFKTNTIMEFGRDIITEVTHKGCTIRVKQEIMAKNGMLESSMNGGDIVVHSSKQLSGQVKYTRFTPTDPQQVACEGVYEATFTRPDSVVAPTY
jgi:hypothetical protein